MSDPEKQLNSRHLKALSMQILRVNGKSVLKKNNKKHSFIQADWLRHQC